MNTLKLVALGTLVSFALSVPAQAQTNASESQQNSSEPAQIGMEEQEQLPPELTQPLEIDQRQADEFFTPPQRQQTVENQAVPSVSSDTLIGPPPGSQTPAELTPNEQLTIPIQ